MKRGTTTQKGRRKPELIVVKEAAKEALETQKIIQNFFKDFVNSPAMQTVREVASKLEWVGRTITMPKIDHKFLKSDTTKKWYAPPSVEVKIEHLVEKCFKEALDKHFDTAKIKLGVKKKIAHCRFCGTPLFRVEDLSYFIKASIKCTNPKCERIVKIPSDLSFSDIQ